MPKSNWGVLSGPTRYNNPDGSYKIRTDYWATYSYSDSEGYSGSTSGTGYSETYYDKNGEQIGSYSTNQPTKIGTAYKTETYWSPKYVTYNNYYGDYSGTVYKYIKQSFTPSFQTQSKKYIVYLAKDTVSNINDLNYVKSIGTDAKVIFISNNKNLLQHNYFIPYSSDTASLINEVVKKVKTENPIANETAILTNQTFNITYADIDEEGDPIIEKGYQYIHDPNYFDNTQGQEHNTLLTYSDNGYTTYQASSFSKVGKYEIYRRIKDSPIGFESYGKYSNLAKLEILVHRKPIADFTLDWRYDVATGRYPANWIDRSYDPDFQYKDINKGIVERNLKYKKDSGTWIYGIPTVLDTGTYTIEYMVKDNFGIWSDVVTKTFTVINRKPTVDLTTPSSTNFTNPTILSSLKPTFSWTFTDPDSDTQKKFKLSLYRVDNNSLIFTTNEITSSNLSYTMSNNLSENINYYVTIQGFDGFNWSDVSKKYFKIIMNQPPVANFTWSPNPIFEGDTLTLTDTSTDPDNNITSHLWTFKAPNNNTTTNINKNTSINNVMAGNYTITKQTTDSYGSSNTITKTITVGTLGITGYVKHTDDWEQKRIEYNSKYDPDRPYSWFWKGEKFILEGATTDTRTSTTKAQSVEITLREKNIKAYLSPNSQKTYWTGEMWQEDFLYLPDGYYHFDFKATYSNGIVKTTTVTIEIRGNFIWGVHRVK